MTKPVDIDAIVQRIRSGIEAEGSGVGARVLVRSQAIADAVIRRLSPFERRHVHVAWADYPEWDFDDSGEFIERTHYALRRQ